MSWSDYTVYDSHMSHTFVDAEGTVRILLQSLHPIVKQAK